MFFVHDKENSFIRDQKAGHERLSKDSTENSKMEECDGQDLRNQKSMIRREQEKCKRNFELSPWSHKVDLFEV